MKRMLLLLAILFARDLGATSVQVDLARFCADCSRSGVPVRLDLKLGPGRFQTTSHFGSTDGNGQITFDGVAPGDYRLGIANVGLAPLEITVPDSTTTQLADALITSAWTPPAQKLFYLPKFIGGTNAFQFVAPSGTILKTDDGTNWYGATATSGGGAINPTDRFVPFRTSDTTFADSPLVVIETNRLGFADTNRFFFHEVARANIGIGRNALSNPSGSGSANNIVIGNGAATNVTSTAGGASGNTFVGTEAAALLSTGDFNVGLGFLSLQSLTSGENNTAVGRGALASLDTGIRNTAIGVSALDTLTGSRNTAAGYVAGSSLGEGIENTFLGYAADAALSPLTNSTAVGANAIVYENHMIALGHAVSKVVTSGTIFPTNGVNYMGVTNLVPGTITNMNTWSGRVRLAAGQQTYFITNTLVTVNSIVSATVNSDDGTVTSSKAIPSAGLITLKANGAAAADTDISWLLITP